LLRQQLQCSSSGLPDDLTGHAVHYNQAFDISSINLLAVNGWDNNPYWKDFALANRQLVTRYANAGEPLQTAGGSAVGGSLLLL
jgi:hypothetical protein